MDAGALTTLAPATGAGAVLILLVSFLIKLVVDNQKSVTEERARTVAALDRADLAQLQVDEERAQRREAEHRAAAAEAKAAAQDVMLEWHRKERDYLRRYLPAATRAGVMPDAPELWGAEE